MKTLELRDKPLFQATLGDLIEALNEGFANVRGSIQNVA